jgi:hypothetical protein
VYGPWERRFRAPELNPAPVMELINFLLLKEKGMLFDRDCSK